MTEQFVSFQEFTPSIRERFTDERYNLLPKEDLERIEPLSVKYAQELWRKWVSSQYNNLMSIDINGGLKDTKAARHIKVNWDSSVSLLQTSKLKVFDKQIRELEPIGTNLSLYFFWDSHWVVKTTWAIFVKYWTDFCYPSDESNLIIFPNSNLALEFVDGYFAIIDRFREFSQVK